MDISAYDRFMYAAEAFYTLCTVRDVSELTAEKKRMDDAWNAYLQDKIDNAND